MKRHNLSALLPSLLLAWVPVTPALAQGTAFTYQGRLTDGGGPASGLYDLRSILYDADAGGSIAAGPLTNAAVGVNDGLFTVTLDFGSAAFPGANRWLEIGVRTNGGGAFATLSPRQSLAATPYAVTAGSVTGANIARLTVPDTTLQALGVLTVTSGFITSAAVTSGGSGYTAPPAVTVNDTTGSGAIVTATVSGGAVVSLTVQSAGTGYSPNATLTLAPPPSNARQTFVSTNLFTGVNTFSSAANVFVGSHTGNGGGLTNVNAATLGGLAAAGLWQLGGNSGSTAGVNFLGTADDQALELKVHGARALRLEPTTNGAPNLIAGAAANAVDPGVVGATISGGGAVAYLGNTYTNRVSADFGTVGGGVNNTIGIGANYGTVEGGAVNTIQTGASYSTIGGGLGNAIQTNGQSAVIGGGNNNTINGAASTIGGGQHNTASGLYATVPGGFDNTAAGSYGFAAGRQAKANHDGAFVWADDSVATDFVSTGPNQFLLRAAGGVGINNNHPVGALDVTTAGGTVSIRNEAGAAPGLVMTGGLAPGTLRLRNALEVWPNVGGTSGGKLDVRNTSGAANITLSGVNGNVTCVSLNQTSDRNAKENFQPVDPRLVLNKVAALGLSQWNFKEDREARHLGPMAQDFHVAFGLGADDKHIATVDEGGVALAAIQGLNQKLEELGKEKDARLTELERRLARLEQLCDTTHGGDQ